ncbi:unnamed protein product, partial [Polarella glacialis]
MPGIAEQATRNLTDGASVLDLVNLARPCGTSRFHGARLAGTLPDTANIVRESSKAGLPAAANPSRPELTRLSKFGAHGKAAPYEMPLTAAASSAFLRLVPGASPQETANRGWAPTKAAIREAALLGATSLQALPKLAQFTQQNPTNLLRGYGTTNAGGTPVAEAASVVALAQVEKADPQTSSNTVRTSWKLASQGARPTGAAATASPRGPSQLDPLGPVNLICCGRPPPARVPAASLPEMEKFTPQQLSNAGRPLGKLLPRDESLCSAPASPAKPGQLSLELQEAEVQECGNVSGNSLRVSSEAMFSYTTALDKQSSGMCSFGLQRDFLDQCHRRSSSATYADTQPSEHGQYRSIACDTGHTEGVGDDGSLKSSSGHYEYPQGLANSAWTSTKAAASGLRLAKSTSAASIKAMDRLDCQATSSSAWAFGAAKAVAVTSMDVPAGLRCEAQRKAGQFHPQALSNTGWGHATLSVLGRAATACITDAAPLRASIPDAQHLANTGRAHRTPGIADEAAMQAIPVCVLRKAAGPHAQNSTNSVWSYGTAVAMEEAPAESTAGATSRQASSSIPLELTNLAAVEFQSFNAAILAWSFAKLVHQGRPLTQSTRQPGLSLVTDYSSQELSNTIRPFATLGIRGEPVAGATAGAAIPKIGTFSPQHLTNTGWRLSEIFAWSEASTTAAARATGQRLSSMRFGDGHTMFWALERGLDFTSLWLEFDSWVAGRPATDVLDLGIMLPGCEALRDAHREQRVWQLICSLSTLRRDVQEIVSGVTGNARNPLAYIDKQSVGIDFLGAQVARHGGHAQHKLAMLVQHVEAVLSRGPRVADDVLEAIVEFSMKKFNYWLKVAADVKGTLLNYALDHAKAAQGRVRMELGAYAWDLAWRVLSLEVDPLHVCIARHMLNLGERSGLAEVRTGQVRDLLPKVVDDFGQLSVGLVFMDHRGTRFHEELRLFEREAMLLGTRGAVFLWEALAWGCGLCPNLEVKAAS